MEIAIEIDPADLGSPLRLAVTLLAFSKRLQQTGDSASAHQTAQDALGASGKGHAKTLRRRRGMERICRRSS